MCSMRRLASVSIGVRSRQQRRIPQIKRALRVATDRAHELGIIGVPTITIDGEPLWGDDRLEDAAAQLRSYGRVDDGRAGEHLMPVEHRLPPQRHRKALEGPSPLLLRTLVTGGDVGS